MKNECELRYWIVFCINASWYCSKFKIFLPKINKQTIISCCNGNLWSKSVLCCDSSWQMLQEMLLLDLHLCCPDLFSFFFFNSLDCCSVYFECWENLHTALKPFLLIVRSSWKTLVLVCFDSLWQDVLFNTVYLLQSSIHFDGDGQYFCAPFSNHHWLTCNWFE